MLMYVLIDDGSAIRPPIGQGDVQERRELAEPEREPRFAVAHRHGLEARAEVLRVERSAPDHHGEPGDGERIEPDPDLREREVEHEDLDEDRRVPDRLDVDAGELAHDRDAVGTRGAQDEPDDESAGDTDRRRLERAPHPGE